MTDNNAHEKLAESIKSLDAKVERRFRTVNRTIRKTKEDIMTELKPLFEDFTGRTYVAKNKPGIVVDPSVIQVIKWLVLGILIAVGGAEYL